jgi:hypothetical protein
MNMKSLCSLLFALVLSTAALAQTTAPKAAQPPTESQKSFDQLKSLAGSWRGKVTVNPPMPKMDGDTADMALSLRVTSRGNAIVEEFQQADTPLDYTKFDHPVTMIYRDGEQLTLVHYCDAGNRPRMTARPSADGKTIEFDFADISGSTKYGHMHHAVFTYIDDNHHTEDWTYMLPGDKAIHAHFDLVRAKN